MSICRDRVGIKPVYVYFDGTSFAFASELKALKTLPWLNLELDKESISTYVRLNYIPSPYSIFKNVSKLSPGSIMEINLNKHVRIKSIGKFLRFYVKIKYRLIMTLMALLRKQ